MKLDLLSYCGLSRHIIIHKRYGKKKSKSKIQDWPDVTKNQILFSSKFKAEISISKINEKNKKIQHALEPVIFYGTRSILSISTPIY